MPLPVVVSPVVTSMPLPSVKTMSYLQSSFDLSIAGMYTQIGKDNVVLHARLDDFVAVLVRNSELVGAQGECQGRSHLRRHHLRVLYMPRD